MISNNSYTMGPGMYDLCAMCHKWAERQIRDSDVDPDW